MYVALPRSEYYQAVRIPLSRSLTSLLCQLVGKPRLPCREEWTSRVRAGVFGFMPSALPRRSPLCLTFTARGCCLRHGTKCLGDLHMGFSRLISVHLHYGLNPSCLRFTTPCSDDDQSSSVARAKLGFRPLVRLWRRRAFPIPSHISRRASRRAVPSHGSGVRLRGVCETLQLWRAARGASGALGGDWSAWPVSLFFIRSFRWQMRYPSGFPCVSRVFSA